jgi:hypothetical protein
VVTSLTPDDIEQMRGQVFFEGPERPGLRRPAGVVIIVLLLAPVLVPLWINSDRVDKTTVRQADVQAVAEQWASQAVSYQPLPK